MILRRVKFRLNANFLEGKYAIFGKAKVSAGLKVERSPGQKWYRPDYVYPDENYPPYSNGRAQTVA